MLVFKLYYTMWLISVFCVLSGLPLRPSDSGNYHGHTVHYHRTGFFSRARERHLHFNPPVSRTSQNTPVEPFMRNGGIPIETYLRNGGAKLHHAAIYEVPSNKHYNDPRSGHELDLRLRSLVERYYNSDGKTTLQPTVITSTTSPPAKRNKPQQVRHIVKSPSTVLSHFLNVEMREFHEQPVQSTKIEPKHIPDPSHATAHIQRRKKPVPKLPTKSYPLGLQFLNKNTQKERQSIPRILVDKVDLPLVKLRSKPTVSTPTSTTIPPPTTSSTTPTTTTTTTTLPTTTTTTTPATSSSTTTTTTPTTTTTSPTTTTTPSVVVTYPPAVETTTSFTSGLEAELGLNDPLFSISIDSLFSDPDLAAERQSGASHGLHHGHSHEVSSPNDHMHNNIPHSHHGMNQHVIDNGHHHAQTDHSHGHLSHSSDHVGHSSGISETTHKQSHASVDQSADVSANTLDKLFVGMFNHHIPEEHGLKHLHKQEEVIPVNKDLTIAVNTPSPAVKQSFEKTTVHAKPITKRGIHDLGGYVSRNPKSYIDNVLNVNVWETTPPHFGPHSLRYYVTTAPSVETQINRQKMSQYLTAKMSTSHSDIPPSSSVASAPLVQSPTPPPVTNSKPASINPSAPNVSQKDLVHLRGIHIMFSNGKQDTSGKIPTIHLTASVSERSGKNISKLSTPTVSTSPPTPTTEQSTTKPSPSVVDKIVGTAVIRNGHLYLILYPFGENKTLKLNFNGSQVSQIPLPHNKPVSYTEAPVPVKQTTKATVEKLPTPQALESMPPVPHHMNKETIASEYQAPASDVSALETHPTSTHGASDHSSHVHGHMHHHMMSATPSGRTTFNDTTIRNFLSPLNKFMSPWRSLDFSKVFPFPKRNSTSRQNGEEDNDLDVVTFIAQATDPFERIKSIMESIANTTLFNNTNSGIGSDGNSSQTQSEAKFNFELKIQTATIDQSRDYKQTTQQNNENNSEEMLYDTSSTVTNSAKSKHQDVLKDVKPDQSSFFHGISNPPSIGLMSEYIREVSPTAGIPMEPVTSEFKLNTMEKIEKINHVTSTKAPEQDKTSTTENVNKDKVINTETVEPIVQNGEMQVTESVLFEEKDKPTMPSGADVATTPFTSKTTSTTQSLLKAILPSKSSIGDFIRYQVFNETHPTSHQQKVTDPPSFDYSDNNFATFGKPGSRFVPGKLSSGSNIQPVASNNQRLTRGQAEQVMSLSDILNDIRRIQLHNMHKFNIQNNNFNNLIVGEASRQNKIRTPMVVEGPLFQETSTRRFSGRPSSRQRPVTASSLQKQMLEQRQNAINDALDAMLVLSVDDILADHTTLHGAIVMSQRQRDQSSSNR